jgi:hypothetical protein
VARALGPDRIAKADPVTRTHCMGGECKGHERKRERDNDARCPAVCGARPEASQTHEIHTADRMPQPWSKVLPPGSRWSNASRQHVTLWATKNPLCGRRPR